jgi:superfamily I DNA and/or RNA helicase
MEQRYKLVLLGRLARNKRSGLFGHFISDKGKKQFYADDTIVIKLFFLHYSCNGKIS